MEKLNTYEIEDECYASFAKKARLSIEKGEGVYAYAENGKKYLDFTAGWGVTSLGHAHQIITEALSSKVKKLYRIPTLEQPIHQQGPNFCY